MRARRESAAARAVDPRGSRTCSNRCESRSPYAPTIFQRSCRSTSPAEQSRDRRARSRRRMRFSKESENLLDVVAVGGVSSGRDAYIAHLTGARAVQVGSALIKEGAGAIGQSIASWIRCWPSSPQLGLRNRGQGALHRMTCPASRGSDSFGCQARARRAFVFSGFMPNVPVV